VANIAEMQSWCFQGAGTPTGEQNLRRIDGQWSYNDTYK
jgi:hypothetical protein